MDDSVFRPNVAYYYQRILANAGLCAREWHVDDPTTLSILLGQSDSCRGVRNNYEVRTPADHEHRQQEEQQAAGGHRRAFYGANHKPAGERADIGYDEHELTHAYSFAEIDAMRKACPDYGRR